MVVVEWAERVRKYLPDKVLWIELAVSPEPGRAVAVRSGGAGGFAWLKDLGTILELG